MPQKSPCELTEIEKKIAMLKFGEGKPEKVISVMMSIPESVVRTKMTDALRKFRKGCFEEYCEIVNRAKMVDAARA